MHPAVGKYCKDVKPWQRSWNWGFFAPKPSNPPKHRCKNRDLRIEISVRFNSGIFKLQSLCSHGNRYFYPLGSALVRWICWEIFSLLGPMKMLGLGQKKNRNKSPPANKKNMQGSGGCPSQQARQAQFWVGYFNPTVNGSKIHQNPRTCAGKISFFFLCITVRGSA